MSWNVTDYPEPPAVNIFDRWRNRHRDLDEDNGYDEYAEDFYEHFEEDDDDGGEMDG